MYEGYLTWKVSEKLNFLNILGLCGSTFRVHFQKNLLGKRKRNQEVSKSMMERHCAERLFFIKRIWRNALFSFNVVWFKVLLFFLKIWSNFQTKGWHVIGCLYKRTMQSCFQIISCFKLVSYFRYFFLSNSTLACKS